MLIAAYVFIGQQSHMSDMPLLHVICTTVKGNRSAVPDRVLIAAVGGGGCDKRPVSVDAGVYLLVAVWHAAAASGVKKCQECKTRLRCMGGLKGLVFFYPVKDGYLLSGKRRLCLALCLSPAAEKLVPTVDVSWTFVHFRRSEKWK